MSGNAFDQFDAAPAGGNAFDQFDKAPAAAPAPPKTLLHQILDYAAGHNPVLSVPEVAAQGATGALAQIPAGLAGLVNEGTNAIGLTHNDPADTVHNIEGALTYQPRSAAGQNLDRDIGATANDLTHNPVADKIGAAVDATGHGPLIRSAVPAVAEAAANVLPLGKGLMAARTAAEDAALAPLQAPGPSIGPKPSDVDPLGTARAAGFKTTASNASLRNPTQPPSLADQALEVGAGGNSAVTRTNQASNTALATQLAGDQMGLGPNVTKITPADLKTAKVAPGATYDATGAKLGDFTPSPNLMNQLNDAATDQSVQASPAARTKAKAILTSIAQDKGQYNGSTLVGDISALRESPGTRPVANLLDQEIERQLQAQGDGPGLQKLLDARRQFAQIYTVQDALNGGQVDPQAVGAVHQANPNLLTGNLRLIGTAAQELPADVKLPSAPTGGAVDALLNGTKGLLGAPLRKLLTSDNYQARNFGPEADATGRSYFKTFGEPVPQGTPPLKLALAPGTVGEPTPVQVGIGTNPSVLGKPTTGGAQAYAEGPAGVSRPAVVERSPGVLPEGPGSVSEAPMSARAASDLKRPLGEAFTAGQRGLFDGGLVNPSWQEPGPAKILKPKGMSDADWAKLTKLGLGE
jgi:hypothetical protein